jgi:hypothetical protein
MSEDLKTLLDDVIYQPVEDKEDTEAWVKKIETLLTAIVDRLTNNPK